MRRDGETTRLPGPEIVTAVINGMVTVLVPFLTVLATRLFAKEPGAR